MLLLHTSLLGRKTTDGSVIRAAWLTGESDIWFLMEHPSGRVYTCSCFGLYLVPEEPQ